MEDDKFKFGKMIKALQDAKFTLPSKLAQTGQLYFQKNFDRQQWDGVKWEKRKNEFTYQNHKKVKNTKHLLVKTGALRQSLQDSVREMSYEKIVWGTDIPYAKYQNFGTDTIPQREFMGESKELNAKLKDKITKAFDRIIKQ